MLHLGKLEPKTDAKTLTLAKLAQAGVVKLPKPRSAWHSAWRVPQWPMLANDSCGDCTAAGILHGFQAWTALAKAAAFQPTDDEALSVYSAVSGYDPNTGANDNGAYLLDVLNQVRRHPVAGETCEAFAKADHSSVDQIKQAMYLWGGAYVGLNLPTSAQGEFENGRPWSAASGAPGSWGGHCVWATDFDPAGLTVVTWGRLQPMTWSFAARYMDECWAAIPGEWAHSAPYLRANGYDHAALTNLLGRLTG